MASDDPSISVWEGESLRDAEEGQILSAPETIPPFSQPGSMGPGLVPQRDAAKATPPVWPKDTAPGHEVPDSQFHAERLQVERSRRTPDESGVPGGSKTPLNGVSRSAKSRPRQIGVERSEIPDSIEVERSEAPDWRSAGGPAPRQPVALGSLEPLEEDASQPMEERQNVGEASAILSQLTPQPASPDAGGGSDPPGKEKGLEGRDSPSRLKERVEDRSFEELPPGRHSTEGTRLPVESLEGRTHFKQKGIPVLPSEYSPAPEGGARESQTNADLSSRPTVRRAHEGLHAPGPTLASDDQPLPAWEEALPVETDGERVLSAPEAVQPFPQPGPLVPQVEAHKIPSIGRDAASTTPTIRPPHTVPVSETPASPLRVERPQVERSERKSIGRGRREDPNSIGVEPSDTPGRRSGSGPAPRQPADLSSLELVEDTLLPNDSERLENGVERAAHPFGRKEEKERKDGRKRSGSLPVRSVGQEREFHEKNRHPPSEPSVIEFQETAGEAPSAQTDATPSSRLTARRPDGARPAPQGNAFPAQIAEASAHRPATPMGIHPEVIVPKEQMAPMLADRRVAAPWEGSAPVEPRPSTPTIRVSIGRVEVRATTPPAPPEPRRKLSEAKSRVSGSARPGPTLSLDDYLKQRNGGQ